MPFATFMENLHSGHEPIDAQHASRFAALNRLQDALRAGDSEEKRTNGSMTLPMTVMAALKRPRAHHIQEEGWNPRSHPEGS